MRVIKAKVHEMMPFLRGVLLSSGLVVAILMLSRLLFISVNVPLEVIVKYADDLQMVVYNAVRFDLQIAAYAALLPSLLMLAQPFVPSARVRNRMGAFCTWYYVAVVILLSLLSAIDLGYYLNFNTHIGLVFFDFFDEEPLSLVQTVWDDYPVIRGLVALAAIGVVAKKVSGWAYAVKQGHKAMSGRLFTSCIIVYLAMLAVCMRGSLGRFPLQVEDLVVSTDERINNIIPNAPYMLKKAMKEKSVVFDVKPAEVLLREYGFKSLEEAMNVFASQYGSASTDSSAVLSADTLVSLRKVLFAHASDTLGKQPNVLILCCESWSNYLLHMGSVIQCGMERNFAEDILFENFQSVRNGTVATIENITVSTPYPRFFRSHYRENCLPSSIALPFINSGYTCELVSGMDLAWENCA